MAPEKGRLPLADLVVDDLLTHPDSKSPDPQALAEVDFDCRWRLLRINCRRNSEFNSSLDRQPANLKPGDFPANFDLLAEPPAVVDHPELQRCIELNDSEQEGGANQPSLAKYTPFVS